MAPYETPAGLRAALEARLANRGRETGLDLGWLRRRALFERMLVRLELAAPGRWIVKGGMALELRLGDRARSTRDLDLALREAGADGAVVRELLSGCLEADREADRFAFRVAHRRRSRPTTPAGPAGASRWRGAWPDACSRASAWMSSAGSRRSSSPAGCRCRA